MRIYHNIPALFAYNAVNATNNALQNSINKLSTGLRINSAADDAAGLAISEKMRAQVRGLDQAVSNSQDGISMIQTAEGALNETHAILQRMRELAVQAANDTLTSNDRSFIQLEIDQLKEEVDRISNTTQFNKKKLLDGSAAVLWSTDKLDTKVIVRGGLREIDQFGQKAVAEGNYKLKIVAEAGRGEIQKSDLFKIKHKDVITNLMIHPDSNVSDVSVTGLPAGDFRINLGYEAAALSVYYASASTAVGIGVSALEFNTIVNATVAVGWVKLVVEETDGLAVDFAINYNVVGTAGRAWGKAAAAGVGNGAVVTLNALNGLGWAANNLTTLVDANVGWVRINGSVMDAQFRVDGTYRAGTAASIIDLGASDMLLGNNNVSQLWQVKEADDSHVIFQIDTRSFSFSGGTNVETKELVIYYGQSYAAGEDFSGTIAGFSSFENVGGDIGFTKIVLTDVANLKAGDKFVLGAEALTNERVARNEADVVAKINTADWPYGWPADITATYSFRDDGLPEGNYSFKQFYLNEDTGISYDSEINMAVKGGGARFGGNGVLLNPAISFHSTYIGEVANGDVKLWDLDKFWDANGKFMIDDPQNITIVQGDGKTTAITIYKSDTLKDVADKMNVAIRDGLGQGRLTAGPFVEFITDENVTDDGPNAVKGTFVIRTALNGNDGKLNFVGDEDLIKALSLNVIQNHVDNKFKVSIEDAHTKKSIVIDSQITGNNLIGVLHKNVDVTFDSMAGITVEYSKETGRFNYTNNTGLTPYETIVHLADNTTVFQIGANEKEDMGINIGAMGTRALGIHGVIVTDRVSAARTITVLDGAIDRVSSQRARLGAYQNRLEHTINNLTVAGTNLQAAESRIRDLDMAKEMMNFTKLNILLQAGNSMLAQANQLPQNVLQLLR
ncbi:MAG: flagellin [Synergistaceae bacterium]|nr:flagellin [Synergistaceae bacterium]